MSGATSIWPAPAAFSAAAGEGAKVHAVLLALFECAGQASWLRVLAVVGCAAMFFYIMHMYVLRAPVPLYIPTAWHSRLKTRRDVAWLKYL